MCEITGRCAAARQARCRTRVVLESLLDGVGCDVILVKLDLRGREPVIPCERAAGGPPCYVAHPEHVAEGARGAHL